jgi:hypothetical protein
MAKQKKAEKRAKPDAPRKEQEWRGEYDFEEDGGALGEIKLRGDGELDEGSVIFDGYIDVEKALESPADVNGVSGAMAVQLGGPANILPAQRPLFWSVGRKGLFFVGGHTASSGEAQGGKGSALVSGGEPSVVISGAPFTAGKFVLVLQYYEATAEAKAELKARDKAKAEADKRAAKEAQAGARGARPLPGYSTGYPAAPAPKARSSARAPKVTKAKK